MFLKCKQIDKDSFENHPVLTKHLPLFELLKKTFNPQDDILFLKAPGRVNLIGEHTDYNMGPVLPCAINKEIVFCVRPAKTSAIQVRNVDAKFEPIEFAFDQTIEPFSKGHWGNYVKAGVKGIWDYATVSLQTEIKRFKGYDILVSSTLPQAAGVSSSSALVVASALAFVYLNKIELSKQKIAEICAKAEHFVGTAGGGMDQAASLLGKENSFLNMSFNPLRVEQIIAPPGIQLVLFSSLIESEKSGKSRSEYNRRVLECKMGVDLFNIYSQKALSGNYHEVNFIGEIKPEKFKLTTQNELDGLVNLFLNSIQEAYSIEEYTTLTGLSEQELNKRYQAILKGGDRFKEPLDGFKIKSRFKHVYSECRRVDQTIECLRKNSLNELGNLINQSHNSLSQDYEVSTAEVDNLVKILLDNGALGARIMGAGFGGMVLVYTTKPKVNHLIEHVQNTYYRSRISGSRTDYIFPCVAADGAGLLFEGK